MTKESIAKSLLQILRYLDARRPLLSEDVDRILQNKDTTSIFLQSIKEARAKGKESFTFNDGDQVYTIELVKDIKHLSTAQ